ncbi:hypothetical protein ACFFX0_14245 [Citricoccus parietis]|uniref:Uncharacterized protein n=1 Tax=Citricoccus parietis TaxID=592307 RepID=A0ABV5G049_9MICC
MAAASVHDSYMSAWRRIRGSRSFMESPVLLTYLLKALNVLCGLTSSPNREMSHWLRNKELRPTFWRPTLTEDSQNLVSKGQSRSYALLLSAPSPSRRWNTKLRTRSAAVKGVPRALSVSKISWESSSGVRSIETNWRPPWSTSAR